MPSVRRLDSLGWADGGVVGTKWDAIMSEHARQTGAGIDREGNELSG